MTINLLTGTHGPTVTTDLYGTPYISADGTLLATIANNDDSVRVRDRIRAWSLPTGQPLGPGCVIALGAAHAASSIDDLREPFDVQVADAPWCHIRERSRS